MTNEDELLFARGEVRDGAAAIENLGHLLGSRRVGPRVLSRALPEVVAGAALLRDAIDRLGESMARFFGDDDVAVDGVRRVVTHSVAKVVELARELEGKHDGLDARDRLRFEANVKRTASELDSLARLADLVCSAAAPRPTSLDLRDVLSRGPTPVEQRSQPGPLPVVARIDVRTKNALTGDARLFVQMLELAVLTAARAGVEAPLAVLTSDGERVTVRVSSEAETSDSGAGPSSTTTRVLEIPLRPDLPGAIDVARGAAKRAGIDLEIAPDRRVVTLRI